MKHSQLRYTAGITLMIFLGFVLFSGSAGPVNVPKVKDQNKVSASEAAANSADSEKAVKEDSGSANVIEKSVEKKKKKFPVLLVVGGAVVVTALLLILLKKKSDDDEFTLKVTVGDGVSGTPTAGNYTYNENQKVDYSYSLQAGYRNLKVRVDAQDAAAAGSITMDGNHEIVVSAEKTAAARDGWLQVNSVPAGADIFINGSASGFQTSHRFVRSPGICEVALKKLGYFEYKTRTNVTAGEVKTVATNLKKGLLENFDLGQASFFWKWRSHENGNWQVANSRYFGEALTRGWNFVYYDFPFTDTNYTLEVTMNRSKGSIHNSTSLVLAENSNPASLEGILLNYTTGGYVSVFKLSRWNLYTGIAKWSDMVYFWRLHSGVNTGPGADNTWRVVRQGNNFTVYINNRRINSFSSRNINPGYIFVLGYAGNVLTRLEVDRVHLEAGNVSGSVAGEPLDVLIKKNTQKGNPAYCNK